MKKTKKKEEEEEEEEEEKNVETHCEGNFQKLEDKRSKKTRRGHRCEIMPCEHDSMVRRNSCGLVVEL